MKNLKGSLVALLALLTATASRGQSASSGRSLYQLGSAWTRDEGTPFRLESLRGQPVVLAMIFTRCGYTCPFTVAQMKELEADLPKTLHERTRFVLVSFDSAGDTPAVLRQYRAAMGLGSADWILLHGDPDAIRNLAAVLGVSYSQVGPGRFDHSSLVTILDRDGVIAGQFSSLAGAFNRAEQVLAGAR